MVVGWVLAVVLAGATRPLYPHYSAITGRPGGISAIADQQLAAGVMWVPASVPWTIAAIALLYAWLHLDRTHQHTTQQLHDASEARPR